MKHPTEGTDVFLSEDDVKRMEKIDETIVKVELTLKEGKKIISPNGENALLAAIEDLKKTKIDIWTYYTEDSEEKIKITEQDAERERPLRVKGMRRKPLSLEKTLTDQKEFTLEELRKLEGW